MSILNNDRRPKRVLNIEPHAVEAKHHYRDGGLTLTFIESIKDGDALKVVRVKGDRFFAGYILEQLRAWAADERKQSAEATEGL